jgi:hypothetical protein
LSDKAQLRRRLKATLTITAIAVLLLATSTVIAANSILQPAYASGVTFKKIKQLSKKDGADPQIAVSGRNVYVVWATSSGNIFFKRSTDGGKDFGGKKTLGTNAGDTASPQIAVSGRNVYVVWSKSSPGNEGVFFTRSNNNGAKFGSVKPLSNKAALEEQIAVSGRNVYVVWTEATEGDIFFTRSTNNGDPNSFSSVKRLSNITQPSTPFNIVTSSQPQIAVSGNKVYVVFTESQSQASPEILFTRSTNNGAPNSFSNPMDISNTNMNSQFPQIAVSGKNVYVVWQDEGPRNNNKCNAFCVFFSRSTNNGAPNSFSSLKQLSVSTDFDEQNGRIAASGNKVYVVWYDNFPDDGIFFTRSNNNGAPNSFSSLKQLSNTVESEFPQIAASGNKVYVVWSDDSPGHEGIFFTRSNNNGAPNSFSSVKTLTKANNDGEDPQIAVSGNKVYVVWAGDSPHGIFFRRGH